MRTRARERCTSVFEVPATPGLTEVLGQGLNWEEVVQATKFPNLFMMPQGTFAPNASELFISEATKQFLQAAAAKYDYVILDTVPVMAADDVTSLAPHVDGVVFVIRAEFTSARVARAALYSLVSAPGPRARPDLQLRASQLRRSTTTTGTAGYYKKHPAAEAGRQAGNRAGRNSVVRGLEVRW